MERKDKYIREKNAALLIIGWVQQRLLYTTTLTKACHASRKSLFTHHISLSPSLCKSFFPCACLCVCVSVSLCVLVWWGKLVLQACNTNLKELLMPVWLLHASCFHRTSSLYYFTFTLSDYQGWTVNYSSLSRMQIETFVALTYFILRGFGQGLWHYYDK